MSLRQKPDDVKGEILRLRDQLESNDSQLRTKAAKRVVNLMRLGENVGILFSAMLRCVKTDDIELKRLVYLYLVTYSEQESEESIMAVSSFVQDSQDRNPLIRALAIRTMSRIKLESVAENLIIPLKSSLKDKDAYVRKTAAIAVGKLFHTIPEAVENSGLFPLLIDLLNDENPMVVSNTTAAISEINEMRNSPILEFDENTIQPILNALPNCSEWCQTIFLDALSKYEPRSSENTSLLIDRLLPFLKNSNPSVAIGAFKCIFLWIDNDRRSPQELFQQILPPFISLVNYTDPEIQYVALRTLSLFTRRYPKALSHNIRIFFCKYNDPSYIKVEKLDIIVTICTPANLSLILNELKEYCNWIDISFVKKAIRAIGQIALTFPSASRACVDILVTQVESKAEYSIEESIIVVADILRKYPGEYESIIVKVCTSIESVKDPASKSALVWLLGEYSNIINNIDVILDPMLDTFHDETPEVQAQLLTAVVKSFVRNPDASRDQLQYILTEATKPSILPEVKDRAVIYWRLLSMKDGNQLVENALLFPKNQVGQSATDFTDVVLTELIKNMGSVCGILHVVPSDFIKTGDRIAADAWHTPEVKGESVELRTIWTFECYRLEITNVSSQPLSNFALALNKNGAGLEIEAPQFPSAIQPGDNIVLKVPTRFNHEAASQNQAIVFDFALRTSAEVVYFRDFLQPWDIARPLKGFKKQEYIDFFKATNDTLNILLSGVVAEPRSLERRNMWVVARKENEICLAFEFQGHEKYIVDLEQDQDTIKVIVKGNPLYYAVINEGAQSMFCEE